MLFQSQMFLLVFLPATLLGWYVFAANERARMSWLILAGLVFYGWWDPRFVPLLVLETIVGWGAAEIYFRSGRQNYWVVPAGICFSLLILIFFKYLGFLTEMAVFMTGLTLPAASILLPIGISFFTFEIVSYLADVRWHNAPRYSPLQFCLFVMLFPRLIAGPIVRHHEIIPQFSLNPKRTGLYERLSKGSLWLIAGLVKKVFLADSLAPIADASFAGAAQKLPDFWTAWSGVLAFTFQLFLDFSAYSEMAIGIALMLGLTLPQNFDAPYKATDLRDFWRRWHMTLSRFLRDYLYIPLGGSRVGFKTFVFATFVTMAICGLWHGAGWTFVAWGLWHGAGLITVRAWTFYGRPLPAALAWTTTFLFVSAGWVLFRSPDFGIAHAMLTGMSGFNGFAGHLAEPELIFAAAAVSMLGPTTLQAITQYARPHAALAIPAALALAVIVLTVGDDQPKDFIYFQF